MHEYLKNTNSTTERIEMTVQNFKTFMDQKIFDLGLSVETVSVYLMCTGLADQEQVLSMDILKSLWNGSHDELVHGLEILEKKGVITASGGDSPCYTLTGSEMWK